MKLFCNQHILQQNFRFSTTDSTTDRNSSSYVTSECTPPAWRENLKEWNVFKNVKNQLQSIIIDYKQYEITK